MRWGGALAIAALLVGLGPAPAARSAEDEPATPRIYRWIDENGVAHYTTDRSRIPDALRGRLGRGLAEPQVRPTPPPPPPAAAPPEPEAPALAAEPEAAPRRATPPPALPRDIEAWAARDRRGGVPDDAWSEGGLEGSPTAGDEAAPAPAQVAALQAEEDARLEEIGSRIAALEAEVAADEEALKRLISDPDAGGPLARSGDPEFRAIAQRLPQRLAELRALREEQAALVTE